MMNLLQRWCLMGSSLLFSGVVTAANNSTFSIGAYYYPWYGGPSVHWPEGLLREELNPPQMPFLGLYDNRNPSVVDQHLQWANTYRISQFICSWWGIGSFEDVAVKDYLLESSELGSLQIALFYESRGLIQSRDSNDTNKIFFDDAATEKLIADVSYMAEHYFDHPNYLTIDGKPVVYFYVSRIYTGRFREAFVNLRITIQQKYGYDLYLVGDEIFWQEEPDLAHITTFDAVTAYNMHGPSEFEGYPADNQFLSRVEAQYSLWQQVAADYQVEVIPGIMPAFNDRATRLEVDHYAIPREMSAALDGSGQYSTFSESLRMAYRVLQQQSQITTPLSTIMITSFNEWHEDTNIEPTVLNVADSNKPTLYTQGYTYQAYGFRLLEMVRQFVEDSGGGVGGGGGTDDEDSSFLESLCSAICDFFSRQFSP